MSKLNKIVDLASDAQRRLDSWFNALTGLGNSVRDKLMSTSFMAGARLPDQVLENLYHDEDMAGRICDLLPEDALRKGYYLSAEGQDNSDLSGHISEYEKRLGFRAALKDVAVWSRVFGGAVIYLGIDDGQREDQPVNMDAIRTVKFATVMDKRDVMPDQWYGDATHDAKYGQPKTYRIMGAPVIPTSGNVAINLALHESRVIRLDGTHTSLRRRMRNDGWCDSVLQRVYDVLMQFGTGWQGAAHLLQDAAQGVFKIDGLIDMIASGEKDTLQRRMELVDMSRSVARAIMLDAEREEFERQAYNFAGVPDVLRAFMLRLAAAADMPVTVLMGQSPAGLNATGENDTRLWYDSVQAYQQETLLPAITRFHELAFAADDFDGERPEKWEVRFESLWQMTALEQATLEKAVADKDKIYIDAGVILPEEVALCRFKARGFSIDTQIDVDARKEMLQAEIDLAKEKAGQEPMPPPMIPPKATGSTPANPIPKPVAEPPAPVQKGSKP